MAAEAPVGYREIPPRLNISAEVLDDRLAMGFAPCTAFVWDGGAITYQALHDRVVGLAGGLAGLGIGPGVPVLFRLPNCLEFVISFLAVTRLGALAVLQNSLLGPEEVSLTPDAQVGPCHRKSVVSVTKHAQPLRAQSSRITDEHAVALRRAPAHPPS